MYKDRKVTFHPHLKQFLKKKHNIFSHLSII